MWFLLLDDTFYDASDKSKCPGPMKISYVNYVPEGKNDNFVNILARLNDDIFKRSVPGTDTMEIVYGVI